MSRGACLPLCARLPYTPTAGAFRLPRALSCHVTDTDRDITIYRADWVLPVAAPVLPDGGVAVAGGRILAVGPAPRLVADYPGAALVDMGRSIIMPGFVNCHSHVEYTSFRGILDDAEFGDWIISLVDVKASLTPASTSSAPGSGAIEAVSSGITTVADTSYGAATLEAAGAAGLRGRLYLEVFGVDDSRFDETMADVERRLDDAQAARARRVRRRARAARAVHGVQPAVPGGLHLARERGLKVMSHVAESQDELTYIRSGSGKFAHDYREKMGWERMLVQPYGVTPIKYLQQWNVFDRDFLAVHCVNVTRDDIRILRSTDVAVAHCPKSNAKLGCGVAPLADLLHEGVRVGLGTDSPASSNIMDMFDEMRTMLFLHRAVERDVERPRRAEVRAHRHAGRRRGAGHGGRGRQPRGGQVRRPHRRRRLALALRAHRRPVLGARLRRQPGRRHAHRRRRSRALSRPRPRRRGRGRHPRHGRRACARSCRTASVPGAVEIGGADSGWWHRRPLIERRPSKCCSIAARSSSGRRSSSGSWPSSWPPSSSSATRACSTAARGSTAPSRT